MAGEIFPGILPDDDDRAFFDGLDAADREIEADLSADGEGCPWCDEYDGEHVGRHASSAHPEAWARHKSQLTSG